MNGAGLFFLLLLLLVILPAAGWVGWTRWRAHQQGLPPPPLSAYIPFKRSSSGSGAYPVGPRPAGVVGWFQDKFHALKNAGTGLGGSGSGVQRGTGAGAHAGGRGSFSQLDPDGAWDDRVGHEADAYGRIGDYEEQELGTHPIHSNNNGGAGVGVGGGYAGRGDRQAMPAYGAGSVDDGRGRALHRLGDEETAYHGATVNQATLDQRYAEEMHGNTNKPPVTNPFGDDAEADSLRGVSPRPVADGRSAAGANELDSTDKSSLKSGRRSMFREDM